MKGDQIKKVLMEDHSGDGEKRKRIIGLSAIGLLDFSVISLYQTGIIKSLPDLPFAIFDSNKVNASDSAYQLGVPDGPVSLVVYAATIVLSSAGGNESSDRNPLWDMALGALITGNAVGAVYYLYDMIFKQKKVCVYCLTGAAINIASAIAAVPLMKKSLRKLVDFSSAAL